MAFSFKSVCTVTLFFIACSVVRVTTPVAAEDTLEKRLKKFEKELTVLREIVENTAKQSKDSSSVEVSLSPTPRFATKDGRFSAKLIGFIQADAMFSQDDLADNPDGTTIRRARVGLAGKIFSDWGYKLLYDFGNNNKPALQDAFVSYNGFDDVQITTGQFKEPFGLEWQSPAKYWTFAELPAVTGLTPRRAIGIGALWTGDWMRINAGVFGEDSKKVRTDDEGASGTAHVAVTPIHKKSAHWHIGASGSYRTPDSQSNAVNFKTKAETSQILLQAVNTGPIPDTDNVKLYGMETLGIWGPVMFQTEYTAADVSTEGGSGFTFDAYYGQISWMLTGESRSFKRKKHMFGPVKPEKPFDLEEGHIGAVELALRYDRIDLTDKEIRGGGMSKVTMGLNWYPNKYIRNTFNYCIVDTDDRAITPNDNPHIFTYRIQVGL